MPPALPDQPPGDAERQRDLSIAHENVGGLQEALGNRAGALKSYSDSLAMRARLAKSDPANAEWQRDLAVVFSELAVAHMHSGAKEKAAGYVRQGREI